MAQGKDHQSASATPRQRWALTSATNVDIEELSLTKAQASRLLDEVTDGREPTVRNALLRLGGIPSGDLPDPDEVGVTRKLGRTTLVLPRGMDLPKHATKVIAEQVAPGVLIIRAVEGPA